jgi:RNA polymerase sigma-70 factor, ECF subfamily
MWERHYDSLQLLARGEVPAHLRSKLDAEDLVQIAMFKAQQADAEFEDRSEPEVLEYLRRSLVSALTEVIRGYDRGKRRAASERSLEIALEQPASRRAAWLAADQTSPTAQARRNEQLRHLSDALDELPTNQRRAVELHYFQRLSFGQTAERMDISYAAAAGLVRRGLRQLRERLVEPIT